MRWIIRGLGLIVLVALLVAGALLLIPSKRVAQLAERQFEAATGRAMTLSDQVHPTIWPRLGVRTGAVVIANAAWSKQGPMLAAKGLEIGLDPAALLQGKIKISKVEVLSPRILLERRRDGAGNWQFTPPGGAAAPSSSAPAAGGAGGGIGAFSLDNGEIKGGTITWIDHATGQTIALSKIDAKLAIPSFAGPATLVLSAKVNGRPVTVSGTLGDFGAFMAGKVVASDLKANVAGSALAFKGDIGTDPVAAQGHLTADLTDPRALAAILGTAVPELPRGLGRKQIALDGDVTLAPEGSMHLRSGKLTLDGNHLQLAADVTFPKGRPLVRAQVEAGALDLSGLTAGGAAPAPARAQEKGKGGWSRAPIDATGLDAVDAQLSLNAGRVDLGVAKLGRTRILAKLDQGRAVVDLRQMSAYGGDTTGQLVMNARSGLSIAADLTAKGVALRPLLSDLADYKRLDANADLSLQLRASGNSQAALARTLAGSGRFSFGKGELQGLDLVGMLRTLNLNYVGEGAKTIFDSINASFTIDKGVLSNDDLTLKAPLLTATGKGTVDIGARTLDYTVTPVALSKADGTGGVKVPLQITGPWARPNFGLDVNALAGSRIDEAKQRLQDRARQELGKQLGVTPQDGQSPQDALRKKLEDQAKKGILNLLK
ncbi:cell envelope biogenesis protein AsmA [Defluviimonas sp. 20V17]|uniref:AsmA protein n=1 Tax=Allgaiera indica TaxID=765699 RepID=A0AAN4URH4_9RHOB|nr:AsmA family protein [Allgaiera indica]KDB02371.1 cell envelope biogenesis protein AsmA [Defluviimonas sp. 20V17]GHE02245.1 cell envelope biogenesis protein AsmA [Allgaiera indica]SDX07247.1 AsmA protein [Allgaiera indica]